MQKYLIERQADFHMRELTYRKVASSRLSQLVAQPRIFRLFMKRKFDPYVLWPLAKKVQNWIVDRSTTRDFTVISFFLIRILIRILQRVWSHLIRTMGNLTFSKQIDRITSELFNISQWIALTMCETYNDRKNCEDSYIFRIGLSGSTELHPLIK